MKNNFKKLLLISAGVVFFSIGLFFAQSVLAAPIDLGLQPLDATGLGHVDIRIIVANIIKSALGLLGILAVVLMLYAGYEWMTSGGNEEQIGTAKKILINATIGLAIILSAYSIVAFVMTKLVEATGFNGGVNPECKIQIDNGGASCGGKCPSCGDCPPGVDCAVGESFHINQKPSGGNVCVANYYPIIVFNKDVDIDSLNHLGAGGHPDNIQVINTLTNGVVDGTWNYQGGNNREVYFFPPTKCLDNKNYYCFEYKTPYKIVIAKSANIKTKSGLQSLSCSGAYNCSDVSFVSGDKIDSTPPQITVKFPQLGDGFSQGDTVGVVVDYKDDVGLQTLNLIADNNFITSVQPQNNCDTSGTLTVNWNTSKASLGSHNIGLVGIDWGNNQTQASFPINLKPTHCYDNKLDESVGEKFSFPSPAGDCGGECGSCAGDVCTQNSNCSSGYCEKASGSGNGVCVNKVRVDYFSLDNGAVGDYVSIFGKYFGKNPGHVYFASSTGNGWIEATPVNCGANFKYWTDNQIIVSVPASIAAAGPLKVVTEVVGVNGTDVTNDSWGASSVFTLTNTSHPGICTINPVSGFEGQPFSVAGKGFGKLADFNVVNDGIFFQGSKIKVGSWGENLISAFIPVGLGNGDFTVQAKKGSLYSNGIKFSVSGSNPNGPIITGLSSSSTARGDYLVIYGKNFGTQNGSVIFNKDGNAGNPNIIGSFDFPEECKKFNSIWNDGQIMVKIPSTIDLNSDFSVRIKLADNITLSPINNNFSIHTVSGDAKPGICGIDPVSGPVPFVANVLNIYGDNLENIDVAYFWKIGASSSVMESLEKSAVVLDTNHHITTKPGGGVASGPLFVTTLGTKKSNTVQFSVSDCVKNNNTCADANDQCCSVGQQSGMCVPKSNTCVGAKRNSGYVWLFSTGGISQIPQVVERCDATTEAGKFVPSPSPSTLWNTGGSVDASNVCQTAVATVEFTTTLDQATVNANTVKIFTCSSITGNKCVDQTPVDNAQINQKSYELKVSNNNSNNAPRHYLEISLNNSQKWTPNTWYQVVLNSGIKSLISKNKYNENIQFDLAANRSCGDGTAYCFSFRAGQGDCKLKQVIVTPSEFWTNVLEEPIKHHTVGGDTYDITYSGNGLSTQRCIMMNVNDFNWTWSPAETQYVKRLSTFGPSNRLAQFGSEANTVGVGLPDNRVYINATAATTSNGVVVSKTGTSSLTIDLSNPKVMNYEPECLEACTDALVSATFNVSMSTKNLMSAVKLYKCNDENCLSTQLVANVIPEIDNNPVTGHRWLKIFNNVSGQILSPNSLYKVVLSTTSTPDINSGLQLWSLANATLPSSYSKPFNQEFSWRFRTKKEACAIDKVDVSPKIFTAQKLSDKAIFTAQPYSSPDACSVGGQKLNPYKYSWNWASSDLQVASVQAFTTKGHNPYCTNNCMLTGSNIFSGSISAIYPVCGNNILEAGEDCLAPNSSANCSLNCLNITKTKKGSKMSTGAKDVNASICGNGMVGIDEDCDLGISPSSTINTSSMFCGVNCLHSGTPLSSAWCKDHKADKGGFSADAFNQACGQALSRCGDGVEDYNEDPGCDIGNGNYDNSCGNNCLKLIRCNAGEAGCSADGQKQGSSLSYEIPSVCGDGVAGTGEDAQCDLETNFVGTIKTLVDPWVLVTGQGGGLPVGVPPMQTSNITGTTNNKSGVGKYQVECGWQTDAECAGKYSDPNRGVGFDSCCYSRPQLTKVFPGATSTVAGNICINTYIEAKFDSVIDINSLAGNLLLAKYSDVGNVCATGTEMVNSNLIADLGNAIQNLAWYEKAWHKVIVFVKNIFGDKFAQASVWCAGSDLASPSVVPDGVGGSRVILQLNQALSTNTKYAVVLKPGIKDIKGVKIRNGADGKPLGWQFVTGNSICEVSSVSVDPNSHAFNAANISKVFTAKAHSQNNQLIVPVPGYSWDYSWGPKVNDFVVVSNTTSSINTITSQNRNGELDVYVSAKILDNKFTKKFGLVGTGRSHIIVFLCENTWPPLKQMVEASGPFAIFPYEDKANNNDNFNFSQNIFDNTAIPSSEVVTAGYFNFSTYYCADSGASGNMVDDLPFLKPVVQTEKSVLGVTSTAQGVCENSANKLCSVDGECALNQFSINGHSFTTPASNSKICVINYNDGTSSYFFNSSQASGQPIVCSVNSDCDSIKTSNDYINGLGTGVTCKNIIGSNHQTLDLKCAKSVTPFNALKRFIFTNDKNGDAIGVQILSNPNHLTARQWFELDKKSGGQGFVSQNGLQDILIDDYDAVTDGNNIYVNALNFTSTAPNTGNLFTNTYLFSINSNADSETRKVFDQFTKNLKFNLNLNNDKRCIVPGNGPTEDSFACSSDFDCSSGQVCSAQKSKLQRDFKRLQDMGKIFSMLSGYSSKHNNTYPDLKAGTYLTGQTISTWPSWSVIGNAAGASFPIDPINKLGLGGTCSSSTGVFCTNDADCIAQAPLGQKCVLHDSTTGWSTENQRFSFACSPNSLAYRYIVTSTSSTVPGANNYKIKMNWEIIGSNNQGLNILNKSKLFGDFVPSSDASKFDLDSATGICNQSQEISSLTVGTCGDGKVGKDESCDPPGTVQWNLDDCNKQGVISSDPLSGNICTKSCQWQINATSTSCGAKLSKCNNGIVEIGEACDEGKLNGQYGHCNLNCSGFASNCGDGTVSSTFEVCDTKFNYSGSCVGGVRNSQKCSENSDCNNACIASPYNPFYSIVDASKISIIFLPPSYNCAFLALPSIGSNSDGICQTVQQTGTKYGNKTKTESCSAGCQAYGPYCGDGAVQAQFGEECDGNVVCSIDSSPGNRICSSNCKWRNTAAILDYSFEDVFVYNNSKSFAVNSASNTLMSIGAYCTGASCPSPVTGVKNKGMSFDGSSDYFIVDKNPEFNLNELTFATWMNVDPATPDGWNPIFTKSAHFEDDGRNASHNRDYYFVFDKTASGTIDVLHQYSSYFPDSNKLTKVVNGENVSNDIAILGITSVNPNISTGEWHFIAVTINAARETRYYVDGKLVGGPIVSGSVDLKADHNYPIWIGRGDNSYFKGKMDEVQLYGRALSPGEIKDLYTNSVNFCELNSVPSSVVEASGSCGNAKIDDGEVCDKGAQNGVACVSGYNKSCTYCSADCKNVVTVSATGYCGDGIINGVEKCELNGSTLYSFATSSGTGMGGLGTGSTIIPPFGGYMVNSCSADFNTSLNASSSYWYSVKSFNNLIGKVGNKSCAANCGIGSNTPIQDNCMSCGLNESGTAVSGAIINVLNPKSTNSLIAEPDGVVPGGHLGYIDLLYSQKNSVAAQSNIQAYKVAFDSYGSGTDFLSYKLRPANGDSTVAATIEANPICSDKNQPRHYRMALNADWSNEHMIDFQVFGTTTPDSYNLFLSPVIPQNNVDSAIDTVARPNDLRIVVSWSGKDVSQFSGGFLSTDFTPSKWVPSESNVSGFANYYLNNNDLVWFHGFGSVPAFNANVEAFTLDTTRMGTSSYAFFINNTSGVNGIFNDGKSAKLKVEIYAAEPQRNGEDNDVYRHFARPIKTFYISQALQGSNPEAKYWHVFNIVKQATPAADYAQHFVVGNQYNSIRTDIKYVY